MLPEIKGYPITPPWRDFSFDEVLDYYDGPRLLLERGPDGQLYLVWWNDNDEYTERWICLPVSKPRLIAIFAGQIPPRTAMEQPEGGCLLVVDIDLETGVMVRAVKTTAADIPQESLPYPGATLKMPLPPSVSEWPAATDTPAANAVPSNGVIPSDGVIAGVAV